MRNSLHFLFELFDGNDTIPSSTNTSAANSFSGTAPDSNVPLLPGEHIVEEILDSFIADFEMVTDNGTDDESDTERESESEGSGDSSEEASDSDTERPILKRELKGKKAKKGKKSKKGKAKEKRGRPKPKKFKPKPGSEDPEGGHVLYRVRWQGYLEPTEEPLENLLPNAISLVRKFHRENPEKPLFGPRNIIDKMLDITTMGKKIDHCIYAIWLLDDTNTPNRCQTPTPDELLLLMEWMEFYALNLPNDHPRYEEQQEFILAIDLLEDYTIKIDAWTSEYNLKGHRRYLRKDKKESRPVEARRKAWLTGIIPEMRKNIHSIPQDRWNSPASFTLVDIGFTYNAHLRK